MDIKEILLNEIEKLGLDDFKVIYIEHDAVPHTTIRLKFIYHREHYGLSYQYSIHENPAYSIYAIMIKLNEFVREIDGK